jgi:hypothetical protein
MPRRFRQSPTGLFSDSASDAELLGSTRAKASSSIPGTSAKRSPATGSAGLASMNTSAVTSVSAADLCTWEMAAEFIVTAMSSYCVGPPTSRPFDKWVRLLSLEFVACREKVTCEVRALLLRVARPSDRMDEYRPRHAFVWSEISRIWPLLVGATTRCSCGTIGSSSALWKPMICRLRKPPWREPRSTHSGGPRWPPSSSGWRGGLQTRLSPYLRRSSTWRRQSAEPDDDGPPPDGSTP